MFPPFLPSCLSLGAEKEGMKKFSLSDMIFYSCILVQGVMVELAGTGVALHAQMVISHDGAPLIMESEFVGRII